MATAATAPFSSKAFWPSVWVLTMMHSSLAPGRTAVSWRSCTGSMVTSSRSRASGRCAAAARSMAPVSQSTTSGGSGCGRAMCGELLPSSIAFDARVVMTTACTPSGARSARSSHGPIHALE